MSSSLRRGALAAAAIAFSIASLSACAAGNNAQTLEIQPDNAATSVGDIKVQNAIVVTQPDLESTGPAVVSATLFNEGRTDQTLESITLPGTGKTAELTPAEGGSLTVPAGGRLIIGGEGNASAVLPSSREAVRDGNAQRVTFTFSETGEVSLRAIVYPAEKFFEEWGPSDIPSAPGGSSEPSAESSDEPADGGTDEAADNPEGEGEENSGSSDSGSSDSGSETPTDAASASQSSGH
ncbi:DUF461 domain-containing protein [Streptomyces pilosus]|uniref:Lipoprotein n=1 Tax=Streptomyces pilosus TaxID=28893 RepID=A0A918F424_9ACTN|nr:DUF461 domain-containing protein [Streptomyces pilosus]GGR02406.1 lipoprotein [Streptomyces pilosus]